MWLYPPNSKWAHFTHLNIHADYSFSFTSTCCRIQRNAAHGALRELGSASGLWGSRGKLFYLSGSHFLRHQALKRPTALPPPSVMWQGTTCGVERERVWHGLRLGSVSILSWGSCQNNLEVKDAGDERSPNTREGNRVVKHPKSNGDIQIMSLTDSNLVWFSWDV